LKSEFSLFLFHNIYRVIILKEIIKKEQADNRKDYYSSVLLSQIFCCTVAVIVFFAVKGSSQWQELKTEYSRLLSEDFLSAEVDTVMADVREYLFEKDMGYAVSGSVVEPYVSTTVPSESDVKDTTSYESKEVFSPAVLSEISVRDESAEAQNVELIRGDSIKFVAPVENGRYTSYFGERVDPISEGDDFHKGVDIGADEGDKIRAFYDGKVTSVGEDSSSGKYLFISPGKGYSTFYCHCSEILIDEGTIVRKGETVALVGSTGYSTGPHLHFEIRSNGESIDPLPFLENAD